jgi:hypothetical protein
MRPTRLIRPTKPLMPLRPMRLMRLIRSSRLIRRCLTLASPSFISSFTPSQNVLENA